MFLTDSLYVLKYYMFYLQPPVFDLPDTES